MSPRPHVAMTATGSVVITADSVTVTGFAFEGAGLTEAGELARRWALERLEGIQPTVAKENPCQTRTPN